MLEKSQGVPDIGRIKSTIDRDEEFLKTQIRTTFGVLHLKVVLRYISSRMMDRKGVMPLPPLTITRVSCLVEKKQNLSLCASQRNHL